MDVGGFGVLVWVQDPLINADLWRWIDSDQSGIALSCLGHGRGSTLDRLALGHQSREEGAMRHALDDR